jgi:hypothetical protein
MKRASGCIKAVSRVFGLVIVVVVQGGCQYIVGIPETTLVADATVEDAPTLVVDAAPGDAPTLVVDAAPGDAPDAAPAACMPAACPFGCDTDTNACRDGKLWIFKTQGAFLGNAFGGNDVPPNVRGGADGQCLATYTSLFEERQCNYNNVHAILHVSGTDSLPLMATKYNIPTNVPVNRAEDDVLVSNNWDDLTDPSKELLAPATTAATDTAGVVWTGTNTAATCLNWTSAVSTDSGTRGYTNRTDATWLSQDTFRCDRLASLLCICWSGGE